MGNAQLNKTYRISHTYTNTDDSYSGHHFFPVITLNSNKVKIENLQIEKGSKATDYEPYYEPVTYNIYLDEPLRKVGNYADYIDLKKEKVVRNVKTINLSTTLPKFNFSTNWDNENYTTCYFFAKDRVQEWGNVLCNYFPLGGHGRRKTRNYR